LISVAEMVIGSSIIKYSLLMSASKNEKSKNGIIIEISNEISRYILLTVKKVSLLKNSQ
jgi:hypothetical protein